MCTLFRKSRASLLSLGVLGLVWTLSPAADLLAGEESTGEAAEVSSVPLQRVQVRYADSATESGEALSASTEEAKEDIDLGRPTHKQVGEIDINGAGLEEIALKCFCLGPKGDVLAACGEGPGEVRIFDPDGQYLKTWEISIRPEAINVGSDGNIYVAGAGKVLKLNAEGETLLEKTAPHVNAITSNPDKIREQVIEQAKQMREQIGKQLKTYEQMIAAIEEKDEADRTEAEKQQLTMLQDIQKQFDQIAEQYGGEELTEEEIDEQVKSMLEYKLRIASISEYNGDVFLATGSAEGYGYEVWKTDNQFEGGEVIVSELRGCCGQMDVQCCKNGVFVAENSRHRVVRYDDSGQEITSWGSQARKGLRGFGSCCNPMNVAFGADGSVYTSEATSGRIKQFSPEGKLLSVVGKVDLVPGCDKVAIGVAPDGNQIYMLDITRNHILRMERLAPGETIAYHESDTGEEGGSLLDTLKSAFGL